MHTLGLKIIGLTCISFTWIFALFVVDLRKVSDEIHNEFFSPEVNETDAYFAEMDSPLHSNCKQFLSMRPTYEESLKSVPETTFAFTIVTHKDVRQFARLLRMIHRPANFYCVHIDGRSPDAYERAILGVSLCFGNNVHVVPRPQRVNVSRGDETVLLPQLICAKSALQQHSKWKYLINLTGQEFPLRTNRELTAIAEALNNSVFVDAFKTVGVMWGMGDVQLPFEAQWYIGSIYGMYPRRFLEFVLTNQEIAQPILKLMTMPGKIRHPDDFLFNTFAYNPHLGAPGACLVPQSPSEMNNGYLGRFVKWTFWGEDKCSTLNIGNVCILGLPHVEEIKHAPHLFANKFYANFHPEAYDQLEAWYFAKLNAEEAVNSYNKTHFNPNVYSQLSCTQNHI